MINNSEDLQIEYEELNKCITELAHALRRSFTEIATAVFEAIDVFDRDIADRLMNGTGDGHPIGLIKALGDIEIPTMIMNSLKEQSAQIPRPRKLTPTTRPYHRTSDIIKQPFKNGFYRGNRRD